MSDKFLAFTGTVKSEIQIGSKSPKIYHTPVEPTSVIAGSVWINSTTRAIKFRNELNTDWLDLASASSATQEYVNTAIASLEFQELTGFNYFSAPTLTTVTSDAWTTGPSNTCGNTMIFKGTVPDLNVQYKPCFTSYSDWAI